MATLLAPLALVLTLAACSDEGDSIQDPGPGPGLDLELDLLPVRTVIGDTLRILGGDFGAEVGARRVVFTGGGSAEVDATILSWAADEIAALVPAGAVDGDVVIADGEQRSDGAFFDVAPELVSFLNDVKPIFNVQGCTSCHGGTNNLFLDTPATILEGGDHGPAVIPRRGAESLLVRVLRGTAPGLARMPFGSPPLPAADIILIEDWVNQGVRNN